MAFLPYRNFVHLSQAEAYDVMQRMLSGGMSSEEIREVLVYFRRKGETVTELVGFAAAMRDRSAPVPVGGGEDPLVDTCGTGGDGACTFNISTAAAFIAAGAGLRLAKHGNRRITSQCGSADVLEALGVQVSLASDQVAESIRTIGIGFLYAPEMHPATQYAQEARQELKGRTIFNLLGPLTNPVRARVQLIGAYSVRAAEMLAQAAARLGVERAFAVHGADGLDEITTTGATTVFQVEDGRVQKGRWTPADFGVEQAAPEDLAGGDPETNAAIIRSVLEGEAGPRRDTAVVNAAAVLFLAERAPDLKSAMNLATEAIDTGAARKKLEQLVQFGAGLLQENVMHEAV